MTDIIRYTIVLLLVVGGVWYFYFNKPPVHVPRQTQGRTMGTDYAVKVHDVPDHVDWDAVCREIQATLDRVDAAMSTFKPDSEVRRFNASASTDWFDVSAETARVVHLAREISALTSGAFDITVAPLVDLWGFGPKAGTTVGTPGEERLDRASASVGYDKLEVRLDPPALKKSVAELAIDLSAVAKGYAADAVGERLEALKLGHYMVEIGGEVRCRGRKGTLGEWAIGIEKPLLVPPGMIPGLQRTLYLADQSLATSGDYQNYRNIDGVRYSHLLDPRTGAPTEKFGPGQPEPAERLGSVSVLDPSCARADALATALFVLGEKEGLALAREHRLPVLFLFRTAGAEPQVREAASPLFPK